MSSPSLTKLMSVDKHKLVNPNRPLLLLGELSPPPVKQLKGQTKPHVLVSLDTS